ncbi:tyrosine-type recombinase/integrase [Thermophagus sp. OGC60D27]|uniref:tyrosine-type recombinase/integrase n=1 Tax=Thermophagus sp. OGC60D27 TaxID=3458415 RepID=UPI00403817CB
MASVSFHCIRGRKGKDSINVKVTHKGKQWKTSSGIKIPSNSFNSKKQIVRPQFDKGENKTLNNLRVFLNDKIKKIGDFNKLENDWLKQYVNEFFNPKNEKIEERITLFKYIDNFILKAKNNPNPKTGKPLNRIVIRDYIRTFELLKEFSKKKRKRLDFNDIDLDFYSDFISFLQKKDYAANTVGKFIKNLKVFLNKATEEGINTNLAYKSHRFVKIQVETDKVYLNEKELKQLEDLNLSSKPYLERVRDLFLIGCWTGLRFGDLTRITPDKIENGYINIIQSKTSDRVIIPLHPIVKRILSKYNGKLPSSISNQKTNKYIKEVARLAGLNQIVTISTIKGGKKEIEEMPKYSLISTHTARRSFATNLYKAGFPAHSIMRITGHKSESSFLKYIKVSPQEHAELLAKFWDKKLEEKAI